MNRLYIILVVLITSCSGEIEKSLIIDKIPDDPVLTISIKEFENINFQTLELSLNPLILIFHQLRIIALRGKF